MTPQDAINILSDAGHSEADISRELRRFGVQCSQSTINRIKHGSVRYSWDTGEALIRFAREVAGRNEDHAA